MKDELSRLIEYNDVLDWLLHTCYDLPHWLKSEVNGREWTDSGLRHRAATVLGGLFKRFGYRGRHKVMLRLSEGLDKNILRRRLHLLLLSCVDSSF